MVPRHQEPQLVRLLMNKPRGHAFLAVEDSEVMTLHDFGNKLKDMFGREKPLTNTRESWERYSNDREKIY